MTIKVGDKVRHDDGDTGEVICFRGVKVFVWWQRDEQMAEYHGIDALLEHATPEPEPAPLTGAQVAQVFDRLRHYLMQEGHRFSDCGIGIRPGELVNLLTVAIAAERERDRG